jgi:hypothetical protein
MNMLKRRLCKKLGHHRTQLVPCDKTEKYLAMKNTVSAIDNAESYLTVNQLRTETSHRSSKPRLLTYRLFIQLQVRTICFITSTTPSPATRRSTSSIFPIHTSHPPNSSSLQALPASRPEPNTHNHGILAKTERRNRSLLPGHSRIRQLD